MTLAEYREKNGLSLEAFGKLVDKSKGHIHAIERTGCATAKLALAIERATQGLVSAAELNAEIAEAQARAA